MTDRSEFWKEKHVREYLQFGDDSIPCRSEQLDILLSVLPGNRDAPLRLLDLGCGDGVLLDTLLGVYPRALRAAAVDGAIAMLTRARRRLMHFSAVELINADLADAGWAEKLGRIGKFDVVVSRFAIHHIEDEEKKLLFARVLGLLDWGGVFVNIEHVRSRTPTGERLFEQWYARHLEKMDRAQGRERSYEELLAAFQNRLGKQANRLATVDEQILWMDETGFKHVDCIWKSFELAMIVGFQREAA
jgi:tRNA (cmo5U34)-methyltransferase